MRQTLAFAVAAAALLMPASALAQSASTTRIETRPFYGATVTLEEGVRVFRPLPPHGRVIINPGGRTPLNLSYEEHHSVSKNYHYGSPGADSSAAAYAAAGEADRGRGWRRHGHGHHPYAARGIGGHGGHGGHGGRR